MFMQLSGISCCCFIHQFLIYIYNETDRIHILPNFHPFPTLLLLLESIYYGVYLTPSYLFIILANSVIYL